MKTTGDILKATFGPTGFTLQNALGLPNDHTLIADPAYKRILFAMEEYKNQELALLKSDYDLLKAENTRISLENVKLKGNLLKLNK